MKKVLFIATILSIQLTSAQLYTPSGNIIGATSNGSTGNIGIGEGNNNPQSKLAILNNGAAGSNQFELRTGHLRNPDRYFMKNIIYGTGNEDVTFFLRHDGQMFVDGNVGIGTTVIENSEGWNKALQIRGNEHSKILASSSNVITGLWAHNYGFYGAPAGGITGTYTNHPFSFITNGSSKMTVFPNGKVTIGSPQPDSDPDFLLYVKKGIKAEQVKVEMASANGWADYVFKKDYKLNALEDVEKHIEDKGRLPNIPSADEVKKNGINLGEMDAKLLEKIEELTLYVIQLNKDVKKLEEENKQLKQKGILTE